MYLEKDDTLKSCTFSFRMQISSSIRMQATHNSIALCHYEIYIFY